jgi:predicted HAD superfamily phosphohydrolase YqeG
VQYSLFNQNASILTVIQAPYLPPLPEDKKNNTYTLVLDLDETLVHYNSVHKIFYSY